jgi:hypothetical protein
MAIIGRGGENLALTPERKEELIKTYQVHENDTGSPEVQIAILTERSGTKAYPPRMSRKNIMILRPD